MKKAEYWALILTLSACSSGTAPMQPIPSDFTLQLQQVASGLSNPVHLSSPPGDPRLFIVEQQGRIRIFENGQLLSAPFLDISPR